jgi:XTP/dITP diphosphohydrolase
VTKLLLATRNEKKLGELRRILVAEGISGIEVLGLADVPSFPEAPETAPDFEGNAVAKARDAVAACGLPTTRASRSTR